MEKWRQAWRRGGAEALRSKGPHGRPRLDQAQFARLEAELNRGPAAHGWVEDQRWTLERVAEVIRRLFGIGYTRPGVSLLLRLGSWSVQVPGRRAIERDEQAVEVWKTRVWPQVEPPRATWGPGSASKTRPVRGSGRPKVAPGAAGDTARR
ncbi:winged helix-turn-helix domain-containing protein [Spirillospora sp. CA-108201]